MPYRDDRDIDLTEVNFTRGMLAGLEQRVLLDAFSGYVSAVEGVVNDGKEATVYRCRPKPEVGNGYLAAKMYRARKFRAFGNDARYVDPSRARDRRLAKAIKQRSRKGRRVSHRMWIDHEWHEVDAVADAWLLFYRDMENIRSYFRRQGMILDTLDTATRLWSRVR